MVRISSTKPEHELKDFPWDKVTFSLDENGDFNMTEDVKNVWQKYGFFVVKKLFSQQTMEELELCSKDPQIQVRKFPLAKIFFSSKSPPLQKWEKCFFTFGLELLFEHRRTKFWLI